MEQQMERYRTPKKANKQETEHNRVCDRWQWGFRQRPPGLHLPSAMAATLFFWARPCRLAG
ncbi:hypothetical protein [Paracoccus sp. NSM]|uniref:hypothetical protein n=1 Tax=Paracoccus sp. NSM TaxID=3457784 RepID=UPI0040375E1F